MIRTHLGSEQFYRDFLILSNDVNSYVLVEFLKQEKERLSDIIDETYDDIVIRQNQGAKKTIKKLLELFDKDYLKKQLAVAERRKKPNET